MREEGVRREMRGALGSDDCSVQEREGGKLC